MAVVIDASSPAIVNGSGTGTLTTASFTPPTGSMVVAVACGGYGNVTAATISDSLSGTWTSRVTANNTTGGNGGMVQISTRTGSGSAMTVSVNYTGLGGGRELAVYVLTGALTSSVGASKAASPQGTSNFTTSITTTTNGALVVGGADTGTTNTTATLGSNTAWATMTGTNPVANSTDAVSYAIFKGSSTVGTPGATTMGVTWGASGCWGQIALLEILPATNSTVTGADSANPAADTATVRATITPTTDTGTGADTALVATAIASGDTGTGAESATVKVFAGETSATDDNVSAILSGGSTLKFGSDAVGGTDGTLPMVMRGTDTGQALDVQQTALVGIQGPLPLGPRIVYVMPVDTE